MGINQKIQILIPELMKFMINFLDQDFRQHLQLLSNVDNTNDVAGSIKVTATVVVAAAMESC